MTRQSVRLGFLYPGVAAEDDYPRLAERLGAPVEVELVHTSVGEDAHRIDALLDLGSAARLLEGAEALHGRAVDAVMWACTSGSFVFGWDGARRQVAALEEALGVPVSSTSFAFTAAAEALGVRKVAVAATYPEDVSREFTAFLAEGGVEVVHLGIRGIVTAEEVGRLGREAVVTIVRENDHPEADAVLVPDTALHSADWLEELEDAVGKPVLTANQVTMWQALVLAGYAPDENGLGTLFSRGGSIAPGGRRAVARGG